MIRRQLLQKLWEGQTHRHNGTANLSFPYWPLDRCYVSHTGVLCRSLPQNSRACVSSCALWQLMLRGTCFSSHPAPFWKYPLYCVLYLGLHFPEGLINESYFFIQNSQINFTADIHKPFYQITCMGQVRHVYEIFVGKPKGKRPLGRPKRKW